MSFARPYEAVIIRSHRIAICLRFNNRENMAWNVHYIQFTATYIVNVGLLKAFVKIIFKSLVEDIIKIK